MDEPSSLLRAGRILTLIGAGVSALGALILLGVTGVIALIPGSDGPPIWFVALYGVLALIMALGAGFGFMAARRVKDGHIHRAWVLALTGALLPPVQTILLVGAILIYVSPEHDVARP